MNGAFVANQSVIEINITAVPYCCSIADNLCYYLTNASSSSTRLRLDCSRAGSLRNGTKRGFSPNPTMALLKKKTAKLSFVALGG